VLVHFAHQNVSKSRSPRQLLYIIYGFVYSVMLDVDDQPDL